MNSAQMIYGRGVIQREGKLTIKRGREREGSEYYKPGSSGHVKKLASRKHLRTKVTPDFHLIYSKNGGNLGSESK